MSQIISFLIQTLDAMDHILCLERQYQKIAMDSSFNQNETVTLYMGHSVYVCCINIVFKNKFQNITTSTF